MKNKRIVRIIGIIISATAACLMLNHGNTYAAGTTKQTTKEDLYKKALIQGLRTCYESKSGAQEKVNLKSNSEFDMSASMGTENTIVLPYMIKNTLEPPTVNCRGLMMGIGNGSKFNGIVQAFGKYNLSKQYEPWGYVASGGGSNKKCFSISYTTTDGKDAKTNQVCMDVDANGYVKPKSLQANSGGKNKGELYLDVQEASRGGKDISGGTIEADCGDGGSVVYLAYRDSKGGNNAVPKNGNNQILKVCSDGTGSGVLWDNGSVSTAPLPDSLKFSGGSETAARNLLTGLTVESQVNSLLSGIKGEVKISSDTIKIGNADYSNDSQTSTVKLMTNRMDSARKALRTLTGKEDDKFSQHEFTEVDAISLDLKYIQSMMDTYPGILKLYDDDENCGTKSAMKGKGFDIVPTRKEEGGGKVRWCRLDGVENVSNKKMKKEKVFSIYKNSKSLKLVTFQGVVDDLASRNVNNFALTSLIREGKTAEEKADAGDAQASACLEASGALGWIICPVMTILNDATQGIYKSAIEPILQVNANALSTSNDKNKSNGVYEAWGQFRNYANIAFAIVLAVVILSQLTGIGLNNYNIKKILPRLIMVIVLVNISFILCQLAVDVSNILGSALNSAFTDLAVGINKDVAASDGGFFGGDILGEIMRVFLGGGTLGVLGVSVALTWNVWLVPLILVVLTFLVSIIFFFIILAVRQAGVFVLIALAPVAIICYALPNTKSIFDKWYKLFTSLLIVYPICGLMMGGGQFASALLLKVGTDTEAGFFMLLTAVVVSVAPFFLIPSILKNSMGALGNIGTKLSNFGSKAGHFFGGAVMGSRFGDRIKQRADARTEEVKAGRAYSAQQRQLIRDKSYLDRMNNRRARGKKISDEQLSRVGRRSSRVLAANKDIHNTEARAERMFQAGGIGSLLARETAQQDKEIENAEVTNTLAEYESGDRGWVDDSGQRQKVDFSQLEYATKNDEGGYDYNDNSLEAEYGRQLEILRKDSENKEALRSVKALQRHFLDQGDRGRAVIQRAFEASLGNGETIAADTTATKLAARAITADSKAMGAIKNGDRGLFAMVNDLNTGRERTEMVDGLTPAEYYASKGVSSYTPETLAKADDGAIDRLVSGINNNTISGDDLSTLGETAREALDNPSVQAKPEVAKKLRQIVTADYAQGASSSVTGSTAGSNAMALSRASDINNAASYIRQMNGKKKFDTTANASNNEEYRLVQGMAQNARTALHDSTKTYTQEQVQALQDVIKAASDMGVNNDLGNKFQQADAARIQVRGRAQRVAPTRPANFDENGNFRDIATGRTTPTAVEQEAFRQYAIEKAAYNRRNSSSNNNP